MMVFIERKLQNVHHKKRKFSELHFKCQLNQLAANKFQTNSNQKTKTKREKPQNELTKRSRIVVEPIQFENNYARRSQYRPQK
jgi:hypothetical protein